MATRYALSGDDSYRQLWSAVVQQAALDLEYEPLTSIEYHQAVAFFVAQGPWAISRREVADMLDLHADDLTRYGRTIIARREAREGIVKPSVKLAPPPPPPPKPEIIVPDFVQQTREARLRRVHRLHRDGENRGQWVQRFAARSGRTAPRDARSAPT